VRERERERDFKVKVRIRLHGSERIDARVVSEKKKHVQYFKASIKRIRRVKIGKEIERERFSNVREDS